VDYFNTFVFFCLNSKKAIIEKKTIREIKAMVVLTNKSPKHISKNGAFCKIDNFI